MVEIIKASEYYSRLDAIGNVKVKTLNDLKRIAKARTQPYSYRSYILSLSLSQLPQKHNAPPKENPPDRQNNPHRSSSSVAKQ